MPRWRFFISLSSGAAYSNRRASDKRQYYYNYFGALNFFYIFSFINFPSWNWQTAKRRFGYSFQ